MRTRVFLNPSNNILVGAYPPDAEHIHVVLDSSNADFTVQLPDVTLPEHKEFVFYNLPASGAGNIVTLLAVTGQLVMINDISHALNPYDTVSIVADLRNRWLISDVNIGKTESVSVNWLGSPGGIRNLNFTNGIYTGYTDI
jgi:hypothetical protein